MSQGRRGVRIRNVTITFNMPKALSLSDGSSQIYTIGPWLVFAQSDNVREVASKIENDVWVETLDGLPPETRLLIEHGSTLRVAIDIGENTRKGVVEKAFDVAKKWASSGVAVGNIRSLASLYRITTPCPKISLSAIRLKSGR